MIINPLRRLYTWKHYAVDTRRSFTRNQIYLHSIGFNSVLIIFIEIYTFRKTDALCRLSSKLFVDVFHLTHLLIIKCLNYYVIYDNSQN